MTTPAKVQTLSEGLRELGETTEVLFKANKVIPISSAQSKHNDSAGAPLTQHFAANQVFGLFEVLACSCRPTASQSRVSGPLALHDSLSLIVNAG